MWGNAEYQSLYIVFIILTFTPLPPAKSFVVAGKRGFMQFVAMIYIGRMQK